MRTTQTYLKALGLLACGFSVPAQVTAQAGEPATGFALSARLAQSSLQELAASAGGAPEFTIGHRGDRFSLGLGVGFSNLRVTDRDEFGGNVSESKTTATLFQVGPDVLIQVWESPNQRTQGNLALGASIGRLSAKDEDSFTGSGTTESTAKGTLYGVRAGLGGDHFIDDNFAIGVEGGFKATFASDIEEEGVSGQTIGVAAGGAYAALRLTVVLGSDR